MVGWHHQLDGHEFEQAPGAGDAQEAWPAAIHGVATGRTQLSHSPELIVPHDGSLTKEMKKGCSAPGLTFPNGNTEWNDRAHYHKQDVNTDTIQHVPVLSSVHLNGPTTAKVHQSLLLTGALLETPFTKEKSFHTNTRGPCGH